MELKVGDRVEVVKSTIEDLNGMFGVIKGKGDGWHWWVTLEGASQSLGFDTRELAPAAETGARGDGSDDEAAEPFELSMQRLIPGLWRVMHKDGVASMELIAEDTRDDSGYTELIDELSGRIKKLERENATLQEQLQKKNAQQKMYKHSIELHEEQYNQARDNATLIGRALQKHAPEAWAEVAKQLNQNVNQYDKLMSDASRGREALAELASVREKLAAAQAARDAMNAILDTYTVSPIDEDKPSAYANDGVFMDGMVYGQWVLAKSLREVQATGGSGEGAGE